MKRKSSQSKNVPRKNYEVTVSDSETVCEGEIENKRERERGGGEGGERIYLDACVIS